MIIRKAKIEDAETIAKNNVVLAKESENMTIEQDTTFKGVKAVISNSDRGFYLVAENDDEILGEVLVTYEWSDWQNKNMWWVQSAYVEKKYRRKSIFSKLLEEVKKLGKKEGVDIIRLYVYRKNFNAINVYNHLNMNEKPYIIYEYEI